MTYKHTQIGWLMFYIFFALVVYFGVIFIQTGFNLAVFIIMLIILLILASFISLTVTIDEEFLRIKFGYGIFKKSFLLKEIVSAKVVKNPWYYGWGIRLVLKPTIWIYNVSGFDAVEITMKDGKRYRIGTDEVEKLEQAIIQK